MLREFLNNSSRLGLSLSEEQAQKLLDYLVLLRKWNKIHNLCAQASLRHMLCYHVLDSISVAGIIDLKNKQCLDVGTGAGLPGLLLAIVEPSCNMVLLDSKIKKITFVNHAIHLLELSNVVAVAERIENFSSQQQFDVIVSRAFSSLNDFIKLTQRFSNEKGIVVAMKSDPESFSVGSLIEKTIKILNIHQVNVPGVISKRSLIVCGKEC